MFLAQSAERSSTLHPVGRTARFGCPWRVHAVGTLVVFGALGLPRFGYTVLLPPMQAALGLDNT